jgi:hypothetical protein
MVVNFVKLGQHCTSALEGGDNGEESSTQSQQALIRRTSDHLEPSGVRRQDSARLWQMLDRGPRLIAS